MLHIIKNITALHDAIPSVLPKDALLLTEEAIYAANSHHFAYSTLQGVIERVFLLDNDIKARGMRFNHDEPFHFVDFDGFVTLTEQHQHSMTWE